MGWKSTLTLFFFILVRGRPTPGDARRPNLRSLGPSVPKLLAENPNLAIFGGVWSLFRIWGSIFIAHCTRTSNLEFQIWGSALIEPKCSGHYFSGFEVPASWNLKSGKVARWSQRVQLNCVFGGLKMAKKCGFQFFHQIETYKRYILEKNWTKNLISALGNG